MVHLKHQRIVFGLGELHPCECSKWDQRRHIISVTSPVSWNHMDSTRLLSGPKYIYFYTVYEVISLNFLTILQRATFIKLPIYYSKVIKRTGWLGNTVVCKFHMCLTNKKLTHCILVVYSEAMKSVLEPHIYRFLGADAKTDIRGVKNLRYQYIRQYF